MMGDGDPSRQFKPPADADVTLVTASRTLLRDRIAEYKARLAGIDGEIARLKARQEATGAQIAKHEETVPLLAERVRARETLSDKKVGTRTAYLELKQQLVEMQGDLRIARLTVAEGAQSIKAQQDNRNELVASFSATTHDELGKSLQRVAALEKELAKAEERQRLKTLRAPVDGTVQQLAAHTVGGVVNPGDPLLVVVPHDTVIEVEAQVLNKDIGFVRAGQMTAIKIESFPFTKYGLVNGEVMGVSADAVQDKERGLIYPARVAMKEKRILVGDKWVNLGPGMAVTVEIKTGERRVVEYFLSPFLKYADEALRER